MTFNDPDGTVLLTSGRVDDLLRVAIGHAGGTLVRWTLDHVDTNPNRSTTATYRVVVDWSYGRRDELVGVSARAHGLERSDTRAEIFADGDREVAVWLYPQDPDLPGLARSAYPGQMTVILNEARVRPVPISPEQVQLRVVSYRPRRRAVVRVDVVDPPETFFVKVLREGQFDQVKLRHELLLAAGVPAPQIVAATTDHLLVLRRLPGTVLSRALFEPSVPCLPEDLVQLLDSMPRSIAKLDRRPPWSNAVAHYAHLVSSVMPELEPDLHWLVHHIGQGLSGIPAGNEPTHGDFHEGQIFVEHGRICGILDVDTAGPGRRADDLACLVGHLATIQRMNTRQSARIQQYLHSWVPVFDRRVDPVELRLRSAAVIVSLATGPYRGREPDWQRQTGQMIRTALAWARQVS